MKKKSEKLSESEIAREREKKNESHRRWLIVVVVVVVVVIIIQKRIRGTEYIVSAFFRGSIKFSRGFTLNWATHGCSLENTANDDNDDDNNTTTIVNSNKIKTLQNTVCSVHNSLFPQFNSDDRKDRKKTAISQKSSSFVCNEKLTVTKWILSIFHSNVVRR